MTNLVFLDLETTGLDMFKHSIWEAAWAVEDGEIKSGFLYHDLKNADPYALEINGYHSRITPEHDDWHANEESLYNDLKGSTIVAANPAFDAGMLQYRWREQPWHYRLLDIEAYAMPVLGLTRPRGIAYIAERLEVVAPDHTAYNDVYTLRQCFDILTNIYKDRF